MVYLYLIGLGLSDEKDITVKGLEIVKKSEKIFLESYTSLLNVDVGKLEEFYGKKIEVCYRETVEIEMDEILAEIAKEKDTDKVYSFLVVGDPFCATTHSDLQQRALMLGIKVKAIHNASIMNAIGICGMQLYRFGQTVSVPFYTENWKPYSFIDKIAANYEQCLHTLVLLDIRVKEISDENLAKGKKIYEPARFMSVNVCIDQIIEAAEKREIKSFDKDGGVAELIGIGVARIGADDQVIKAGKLKDLVKEDFGEN